jgi:hypothetical protein
MNTKPKQNQLVDKQQIALSLTDVKAHHFVAVKSLKVSYNSVGVINAAMQIQLCCV